MSNQVNKQVIYLNKTRDWDWVINTSTWICM